MSLVSSFFPSSYDVLFPIPCLVEHSFPSPVTSGGRTSLLTDLSLLEERLISLYQPCGIVDG
jgi:hypothetical protein